MTVGLGGGHNVAKLATTLAAQPERHLQFCTPSELTAQMATKFGLPLINLAAGPAVDIAFDGCDSIDTNLTALKSNGGIHVAEKVMAQQAARYVILAPASRYAATLNAQVPLTLAVAPIAAPTLMAAIQDRGVTVTERLGQQVASFARTPSGEVLLDCDWRTVSDLSAFNAWVQCQNGVVATSLFEQLITDLLIFDEQGQVKAYRKELKNDNL